MTGYTIITQAGRKCPYCDKAAELLDEKGIAYHLRPLSASHLREEGARSGMTTIPIIYHGVHLVGGFDDLEAYLVDKCKQT